MTANRVTIETRRTSYAVPMPTVPPVHPIPIEPAPGTRSALMAVLRRIDGWGQGAWREIYCTWQLKQCLISVDDLEAGVSRDVDDRVAAFVLVVPGHTLGRPGDPIRDIATCDWVLRQAWDLLLKNATITVTTHLPGPEVRATNACVFTPPSPDSPPALLLRLLVRLPMAGMCCDGKALRRFLLLLEQFSDTLCRRLKRPLLDRHRFVVAQQNALRAQLDQLKLVAFIGDGARLARTGADQPTAACRPWRTPAAERITINLGSLGRVRGFGIRFGITAIAGAPYHGKSTVLSALAAGRDNHIPDDGRELVVAHASAIVIQAEDGRRIKSTDVSDFFSNLPGGRSTNFSTDRASGATSMAASLIQGIAAGSRLLLIDEDNAASNFLTIDPLMRRLLGTTLNGFTTLLEALPGLTAAGVNTVLVAGAHHQSLQTSDHIVIMENYQPRVATAQVRRLLPRRRTKNVVPAIIPQRLLTNQPDCLFGQRHFLRIDVTEPERPLFNDIPLDLRRCGWQVDKASVRGAFAAAAWCCRLADGQAISLKELAERYQAFVSDYGPRALDPFDTALITVPPWQLVVTVLERLSQPNIISGKP